MTQNKSQKSIEKYILGAPKDVQATLKNIQATIKQIVPNAVELISYGIPTFDLNGQHLVHFAAFKKHIGFFPTPSAIKSFEKELESFQISTGTIKFPLDKPIPYELIKRIVEFRVKEIAEN